MRISNAVLYHDDVSCKRKYFIIVVRVTLLVAQDFERNSNDVRDEMRLLANYYLSDKDKYIAKLLGRILYLMNIRVCLVILL